MNPFLEGHGIRPVIDKAHRFGDAVQAFEHLARGPFGNVVVNVVGGI
ncbi:hypothetical protein INH39_30260 [Massilia violaceinigra]|uniref:Alcohol dehydrogenase n=1 Tax=Massilia violaceinigra TaxID=2045208 RepID=A0ABY4AFW1_9BURK|nr:hypothetical protein [Massilia violaceinigra]UOD33692.1 hypothetical protein INH39_30260 [Massilia violaceinigra]